MRSFKHKLLTAGLMLVWVLLGSASFADKVGPVSEADKATADFKRLTKSVPILARELGKHCQNVWATANRWLELRFFEQFGWPTSPYPAREWFVDAGATHPERLDVAFGSIHRIPGRNSSTFRVFVSNLSKVDAGPFDVTILASPRGALDKGLPYATGRIDGLKPFATRSVDLELPMKNGSLETSDCRYIHTIVDSARELDELNRFNNVSVRLRSHIRNLTGHVNPPLHPRKWPRPVKQHPSKRNH
jgi:hypothetical protein